MRTSMRVSILAAFGGGVPAGPAGRGPRKTVPAARDNALTLWLDEANIHPPVEIGGLTFFPVSLGRRANWTTW